VSVSNQAQQTLVRPPSNGGPAIEAIDLVKTYGKGDGAVQAVRGVSFAAQPGTIFGLLGPNGAGKSTTVKILTTLSVADSGTATVAGIDVAKNPAAVRRAIGYVPQKPCFDRNLTARENLTLQGKIYGMGRADLRQRVSDVLEQFSLTEAADRVTTKLSGGQQRKLDVALALIHRPPVLFLDEPTTGLDPEARSELWAAIAALAKTGELTVLLTTHYLEEADQLASQLVIVDRGIVVASGTPDELKDSLDGDTIQVKLSSPESAKQAHDLLTAIPGIDQGFIEGNDVRARVANGGAALPGAIAALDGAGVKLVSFSVARPSLDQVYLRYAGRSFQSAATDRKEGAA
jgi:ABC-2 type transport system ATP-binding protein